MEYVIETKPFARPPQAEGGIKARFQPYKLDPHWKYATLLPSAKEWSNPMSKIRHIAISAQDADATAKFFIEVFGMKEVGKFDGHGARGYYLSDGDLNLAILNFKNDAVAGAERGKDWYGLHHIGFQVESLDEIHQKLAAAGSRPRDDVNAALGVGHGQRQESNVEVKYAGPDGIMIDVSETGWEGTARSLDEQVSKARTPELSSA